MDETSKTIIQTEFLVWLGMKNSYDQIRIIDNTGQEIVRANYNNGSPFIVNDNDLQDKSDRYYFVESINLEENDLYMSVLDLNVENGVIEIINGVPKPMLRVATPLYNKNGVKLGVVVVNYLADKLFRILDESNRNLTINIEIINENGYYLYSDNEEIEFGFMYEDMLDEIFSKYHDYDIFSTPSGEVTTIKEGNEIYTSYRISSKELTDAVNTVGSKTLNIEFGSKEFIIFSELDFSTNKEYLNIVTLYVSISVISLIFMVIITRLIDESNYQREINLERMTYDASHDLLTKLPNRKSIYESIQQNLTSKTPFTVLFIDFDGFKNVNDQFGHDVGDEALIQGSKRIQSSLRPSDVLGRIGGDEFIGIINDSVDKTVIETICMKIIQSFQTGFKIADYDVKLGVSIGAYICETHHLNIAEIISKSDETMYRVKNTGKNNYIIFKE